MTTIGKDVELASALIKNGGVIAIPTETVYGLAGNALDPTAVKKIFEIKNRPFNNPLIVHISDLKELSKYVKNIPPITEKLAEQFWPGPLTMLLSKSELIPDLVTAGLPHVAIRIPSHPVALQLLRELSFPLAAPSANPFGYISPTSAQDVKKIFFEKIDYILDGGICSQGIESTIVGFDGDTPIIYRVGVISPEAIKKAVGKVEINKKPTTKPISPGMLPSHYSPHTPLYLTNNVNELLNEFPIHGTGILAYKNWSLLIPQSDQEILSETGNLDEAGRNLYQALHRLDSLKLDRIIAERVPDIEIGIAINDRLTRAAKNK